MKYHGNIHVLSDELVGAVAMSRVPVMALTFKSPNTPLLAASRSIESTSLSLTVELNFRARSTITHPHLENKKTKKLTELKLNGLSITRHVPNEMDFIFLFV